MRKSISSASQCRAFIVNVLSLILVVMPCLALPSRAQASDEGKDPHENKLRKSTGEAVNQTPILPFTNLPNIDEIKQKAADPELKKLIQPKEKLPKAKRCRPANRICQDYWQKQGKPSSNIGQITPREPSSPFNSFSNSLAWNSFASPVDFFKGVSDVPVSFGRSAPKAAAAPMMVQSGVNYGGWQTEMTQARNRQGSDDLFSGNYHWRVPIVGLPGRAGHDLGLSLSYNSHLWVKTNAGMRMLDYDEAVGDPGGGFTLGLPLLRGVHTTRNGQTAYRLMLPSGQTIELIRRGGSNNFQIYESVDGSLLHLVVETSANQYLFFPDGTRFRFQNFQCTEIRDRNGNQITATYDPNYGLLTKLTDTLGRDITVHYYDQNGKDFFEPGYSGYFEITDLKQNRRDQSGNPVTVTLARFGYSDITLNTNFASPTNVPQGTVFPMLTSAMLADGSLYKFDYTSYGQVKKISHYAPLVTNPNPNSLCGQDVWSGCDYLLRSYTTYNLPSTNDPNNNAQQSDCPRPASRSDWALAWSWFAGNSTTTYAPITDPAIREMTAPNGTIQREYYNLAANNAESWKDGLPFKMEVLAPNISTPKKTTLTTWVNDVTWGPRVQDTTVTDGENNSTRQTWFEYGQGYNLPTMIDTYKGTGFSSMIGSVKTTYLYRDC